MDDKTGLREIGEAANWRDPGAGGCNLEVENFPTYYLARLATAAQRNITKKYLKPFGLSVPEWRLIASLSRTSPLSFGGLCESSSMDKAQVSRALRTIAGKGLAESHGNPEDQRKVVVTITDKGRDLYRQVLPIARRNQKIILDVLNANERMVVHAAFLKMTRAIARYDGDAPLDDGAP